MNPSLLPYIAAAVSIVVFLIVRQGLRHPLGHGPATLVGAMAAGVVYYGFYLYRDEMLAGVKIPDGLLPLALLAILVLLAIATLSRRRPPSPVQRPPVGPSPILRHPPGTMDDEAHRSPARPSPSRPYGQFRPRHRYNISPEDGQYPRRPTRAYPDDRYPDDDEFAER